MIKVGPALLAFLVASIVTALELITSSYPRTFPFLSRCKEIFVYTIIYGLISFGVTLAFDSLVSNGALKLEGIGLSNPWLRATALGISTKALLHIRLFSVGVGDKTTPFGTETIVQMFEPWLLERIELYEFNAVRVFLKHWERQYPDVTEARSIILNNLPYTFSGDERAAFEASLNNQARTTIECMEKYLRRFGRTNFERAFNKYSDRPAIATPTIEALSENLSKDIKQNSEKL